MSNYNFTKVLITGGAGGIGKALAQHMLSKGKKVIIAGRTENKLESTVEELKSQGEISSVLLDMSCPQSFESFLEKLLKEHPDLDAIIQNAGIQKTFKYGKDQDSKAILADTDAEISTNIIGVVHLTTLLLPHLLSKPSAAVFTVSSGLAFVPMASVPTYCASKAFIHSWTISLRFQLANTSVRVIEIAPPLVESDLHRDHADPDNNKKHKNSMALTMDEFMQGVSEGMDQDKEEIGVGMAKMSSDKWHEAFGEGLKKMNAGGH